MNKTTWFRKNWWRLLVSIGFDLYDFTVGRIPVLGSFTDLAAGFLGIALWGYKSPFSYVQFLEVLDISDQVDAEIPSLTISGLFRLYKDTR